MNRIDVIIVNFNSGEYLSRCVHSVLASTVPVRAFVVDNDSTDRSLSLLKTSAGFDARVNIIENKRNLGFARANNQALPMADGEYILFLNPDCVIRPDTLECMLAVMKADPGAGMAGCLLRNPDGSEQAGSRRYIPTPFRSMVKVLKLSRVFQKYPKYGLVNLAGQPLPDHPVSMEAISGAFMFVRRTAVEQVRPMDDGYFMHFEDLDWCMRFRMAGWKILFVPDVEIIHYKGTCSADRPIRVEWHKHRGMIRFYDKYFRSHYPIGSMYLITAAVWARFAILAVFLSVKRLVIKA